MNVTTKTIFSTSYDCYEIAVQFTTIEVGEKRQGTFIVCYFDEEYDAIDIVEAGTITGVFNVVGAMMNIDDDKKTELLLKINSFKKEWELTVEGYITDKEMLDLWTEYNELSDYLANY